MAITTYSELQAAIANYMNRGDLTDRIKEFIDLAEAEVRAEVHDSQMENRAFATASTSTAYLPLPSDFRGLRRMQIVYGGVEYMLQQRPPAELTLYDDGGTGMPRYVAIVGNQFELYPQPDAEYRVEITYYQDLPALTDSNTANWLLTDFPNIYLYGALRHAAIYMSDNEMLMRFSATYERGLKELKRQNKTRRHGSHPLQIKAV